MCKINDNVLSYSINNDTKYNYDCDYKYNFNDNSIICKDNLKCKYCNSNKVNKRGKQSYNNKQRYLCRDCGKIWTEGIDGRVKYTEKQKKEVLELYLEGNGIRCIYLLMI